MSLEEKLIPEGESLEAVNGEIYLPKAEPKESDLAQTAQTCYNWARNYFHVGHLMLGSVAILMGVYTKNEILPLWTPFLMGVNMTAAAFLHQRIPFLNVKKLDSGYIGYFALITLGIRLGYNLGRL